MVRVMLRYCNERVEKGKAKAKNIRRMNQSLVTRNATLALQAFAVLGAADWKMLIKQSNHTVSHFM